MAGKANNRMAIHLIMTIATPKRTGDFDIAKTKVSE